jgi:phosphoglycerate dehydrogenase-like enzyme
MNREFLELGLAGKKQFAVTKGIESQRVGIVGLGRIGSRITEMLKAFHPESICYTSQHRHQDEEEALGITYQDLPELLAQSDIVFICVDDEAKNLIGQKELRTMKNEALLVNITHPGIIDEDALFEELQHGRLRAISDHPMSPKFNDVPTRHWYCMKTSNTITEAGVKLMSDMAVHSMLNLLKTGNDRFSIK